MKPALGVAIILVVILLPLMFRCAKYQECRDAGFSVIYCAQ